MKLFGKKPNYTCKVCRSKVNKKNGIQCQGACKQWAHYSCLNYDCMKIKQIKSGAIKVLCPCATCRDKDTQVNFKSDSSSEDHDPKKLPLRKQPEPVAEMSKPKRGTATELKCPIRCGIDIKNSVGRDIMIDLEYDYSPEKHQKKPCCFVPEPKPIEKNSQAVHVPEFNVEKEHIPQTHDSDECFPEKNETQQSFPQKHQEKGKLETRQNKCPCSGRITFERHQESGIVPERITEAPNIFADKKIGENRYNNVEQTNATIRKTQFNEPLPHNNVKLRRCPCTAKRIQQKKPLCVASLSSTESSFYNRTARKRTTTNQSMINALDGVCHTVGLLSNQLKELMCKILTSKHHASTTDASNK